MWEDIPARGIRAPRRAKPDWPVRVSTRYSPKPRKKADLRDVVRLRLGLAEFQVDAAVLPAANPQTLVEQSIRHID